MYKTNHISFCPSDYTDNDGWFNESAMFDDIGNLLRILIKSKYQCKIWNDGYTTIVEFDWKDPELSGKELVWLDDDEYVGSYSTYDEYNGCPPENDDNGYIGSEEEYLNSLHYEFDDSDDCCECTVSYDDGDDDDGKDDNRPLPEWM